MALSKVSTNELFPHNNFTNFGCHRLPFMKLLSPVVHPPSPPHSPYSQKLLSYSHSCRPYLDLPWWRQVCPIRLIPNEVQKFLHTDVAKKQDGTVHHPLFCGNVCFSATSSACNQQTNDVIWFLSSTHQALAETHDSLSQCYHFIEN